MLMVGAGQDREARDRHYQAAEQNARQHSGDAASRARSRCFDIEDLLLEPIAFGQNFFPSPAA